MKFLIAFALILLLGGAADANDYYTDAEARAILLNNGITVNSPEPKTSLKGVRKTTINGIVRLKSLSGCSALVVTGGTEKNAGHAGGQFSHLTGYKLDIRLTPCLDNYIIKNCPFHKIRSDKTREYSCESGSMICGKEGNHWDILFK